MIDTHFKSKQNQLLHLDTEKILSAPLYILLARTAHPQLKIIAGAAISYSLFVCLIYLILVLNIKDRLFQKAGLI